MSTQGKFSRVVRRLQFGALFAIVIGMLSYEFSGCPAAADKTKAANTLVVVPTDARGKLEYCAFDTRLTREMTRVPDGAPLENLCGPNRADVETRAAAFKREVAAQGQMCFYHLPLLRALGL